jgi:aminopeptidase N
MRLLACATALLAVSLDLSADTYPRQPWVDAIHYRFAVSLNETTPHVTAEAAATFRLLAAAEAIELDLVNESAGSGMRVRAVTLADRAVPYTHAGDRLRLTIPAGTPPGADVTYRIAYEGVPRDGLKVFTNMHGERVVFSEGWPNRARHWLPTIDHPYDKATAEMIVTAPAQWQVVSNGRLVEEVDVEPGRRRTHWRQGVPIASWLFALGAARFDAHHAGSVQGVPLQTWAFPQDRAAARHLFEETSRRAMDFFSDRVGPYPYEKLANVQAAGFGGGMENATVIFYGEQGVAAGRGPVVHEIAHQWFGNSVTERDWDDVWLSEGFATYFSLLYIEHFEGRDAFVQALRRSRDTVLDASRALPEAPVVHRNLDNMARVLNGLVYQKGAWVLHMLRAEVGTAHFWAGMREYYRRYRDRNASTDDLRQVMEQVSGRDLRGFFAQWLTRGGNPAIEGTWRYDRERRALELVIRQTHGGEPYVLPVEVEIVTASGSSRHAVRAAGPTTTVSLPVDTPPTEVRLDPDTWLLASMATTRAER